MQLMKAIETQYKGYRFRSRLEAKWAIFFDALGIQWDYEIEGYDLEGEYYLPDFWLKTVNMWAEVKPDEFDDRARRLVEKLAKHTGAEVLMLDGSPDVAEYLSVLPEGGTMPYILSNYHNYPQDEHRFYCFPADYEIWQPDTVVAVKASRSARFEHGERA